MDPIDLIALMVFVAIGFAPAGALYRFHQKKKIRWRKLANDNGLKYKHMPWFKGGGSVFGEFRGYQLNLESVGAILGNEDGYTQIILSVTDSQETTTEVNFPKNSDIIEKSLRVFESSLKLRGKIKKGKEAQFVSYKQSSVEGDVEYLQSVLDLLGDIADGYSLAMSVEGKALPYLQKMVKEEDYPLQPIILQLMDDIFQKVTARLNETNTCLVCQSCLTRYEIHKDGGWTEAFKYYGCRICHSSQNSYEVQKIVALLDSRESEAVQQQDSTLWVNWLVERDLFDFDEVGIIKATDEDAERFAVQIGNDTDLVRRPTYQDMRCIISPDCELSENSERILRRTFAQVEIGEFA
jgi:hypothetical protein